RAGQELQRVDKRAVDTVPGLGYVVVTPEEQLVLARRQVARAGVAIERGHSLAANVDLRGVDPQVRNALELLAKGFAVQADFNRRMLGRQEELADALNRVEQHTSRTDEQVAALHGRLDALEGALGQPAGTSPPGEAAIPARYSYPRPGEARPG
ncbi:MAG TPA: hypothetical protein VFX70_20170, partial [Mycobacteriales bacterium]|nr:hypothetical protein [Mycobacteriales bacterium]